jgi:hypothetical protein
MIAKGFLGNMELTENLGTTILSKVPYHRNLDAGGRRGRIQLI